MPASLKIFGTLFLFAMTSLMSCSDSDVSDNNDSIIGEWQHKESAFSIGAGFIVEDVTNGEVYRINDNGTFDYDFGQELTGTWEVTVDDVLSFNFDPVIEGRIVDFKYEIDGDELILKPAFVFCTEECFDKYRRR